MLDKRPGVTVGGVLRNWGLVFVGNFAGALTVAFFMAFVTTFGFTQAPDKVGTVHRQYRRGAHARLRGARRRRAW